MYVCVLQVLILYPEQNVYYNQYILIVMVRRKKTAIN